MGIINNRKNTLKMTMQPIYLTGHFRPVLKSNV